MPRLRWRTFAMSIATGPVIVPNCAAWRTRCATFALQISFLLGMQANVGTGAPDPAALDDGSPSPGSRHMPSQELATRSTAKDQDFKPFWLRHAIPPCADSQRGNVAEIRAMEKELFLYRCRLRVRSYRSSPSNASRPMSVSSR